MKELKYKIQKYPDGSQYVVIDEFAENLHFSINSYSDLWTLSQIKDVLNHNKTNVNLTIPWLLDGQADRRFEKNQSYGLKLVCEFINNLHFQKVSIFHPHNPEVVEALIDNLEIIDNSSFIKQVIADIFSSQDLILMSADAGGYKSLMKLANKLELKNEIYSASKSRYWDGNKSVITPRVDRENFQRKNILIIDDLCIYGGTFIKLSEMLSTRNCGAIYLAVSHITVDPGDNLFKSFNCIYTTNSKFHLFSSLNPVRIFDYEK